jgi:DNA-binding response OmpR family regulator
MEMRQKKDVLIVDDDDEVRVLICAALDQAGLSCDTADHGHAALERMRTMDYSVVLLDLVMPQLDGVQVLTELQSWHRVDFRKPVVLIMTAMSERDCPPIPGDVAQAIIRKPLDVSDLVALVTGCVSARQALGHRSQRGMSA